MVDFPQQIYTPEEEEACQRALDEHPVVLNVGGVKNRSRLVIHDNNCRLVRELKRHRHRTRKMLFKTRLELMENLPDRSVRLIECSKCCV